MPPSSLRIAGILFCSLILTTLAPLASAAVEPDGPETVALCGAVAEYTAATSTTAGSLTIAGRTFIIAAGATLANADLITPNADLCLSGTVDVDGQLIDPSTMSANKTATVQTCGTVMEYTAATDTSDGTLTIGAISFTVVTGTSIINDRLLTLGADVCLDATTNGAGQIIAPSSVSANSRITVKLCGTLSDYTPSTSTAPGSLTIDRRTFPISAGTAVTNGDLLTAGANICLSGTLNGSGELIAPSSVSANVLTAVNLCGAVTGYTASTTSTPGSLGIAGSVLPIAPGVTLANADLIAPNALLCLRGTLNGAGQLVAPSTLNLETTSTLSVCGIVSGYAPSTGNASGFINIGGQSIPIEAGTEITNSELIVTGASLCLAATLSGLGEIIPPSSVHANLVVSVTVCGFVTAYSPANANAPGFITIAGTTYPIVAGTTIANSSLIEPGAELCLSGSRNALGQITAPSSVALVSVSVLNICGTVSQFIEATAGSAGSITIGGRTIGIAAGTSIDNSNVIGTNSSLCLTASISTSGQIVAPSSVRVEATTRVTLCGTVTSYDAPTATASGSVTIAGLRLPIAAGFNISNAGLITPGRGICLNATINESGQVVAPSNVEVATRSTVSVCGAVSAFTSAGPTSDGSITIAGQTIRIGAGTILVNQALVRPGADLCLEGALDGSGRLAIPSGVSLNVPTSISICGIVTAYVPATSTTAGSVVIGDRTLSIAPGTSLAGAELITREANLCLTGTLNGAGMLIAPSRVIANMTSVVTVCGRVDAYRAATASSDGSLTIGGRTFPIVAGTTISNSGFISVGTNLCLSTSVNAAGAIVSPSTVSSNPNAFLHICGVVSSFTAASETEEGSITIAGRRLTITAGTLLANAGLIRIGATVCLDAALNDRGEIVQPSSVNAFAPMSAGVCGDVTAYIPATASTSGLITIARQTFTIAAGTALAGSELIRTGANLCMSATLDGSGQIAGASSLILNVPVNVDICGVVSAFTPASSGSDGSIRIAGRTFLITAGTTLQNQSLIQIGMNICLFANTGRNGGLVAPSSVSIEPSVRVSICGVLSAFTAPGSSSAGSFTIAGTSFTIAPGTPVPITGAMIGTDVCIDLSVTPRGESVPPIFITTIPRLPVGPRPAPATPPGPLTGPGPVPGGPVAGANCRNREPILSVPSHQIAELGETLRFRVDATDPDGDGVALAVASLPTSASFNGDTGEFTFTPVDLCDAEDRSYVVTFIGFDANGGSTSAAVQIDVVRAAEGGEPAPPSVSIPQDHVIARVGEKLSFAALGRGAADGCGADIEAGEVANGSYDISTETYSITPTRAQATGVPLVVRFTATDCNGRTSTRVATIVVVDDTGRNPEGRIAVPIRGVVPGVTSSAANLCGAVSSFIPATASTAGRITISSPGRQVHTFPINAGVSITNGHLLREEAQLCLVATLASGSVVAPSAVAQDISFAPVSGGSEAGWVDVPVSNTGSAAITLTSIALADGTVFRIEGVDALPSTLRPGDRVVIRIRFLPKAPGFFTDTLSINSSDAASPVYVMTLAGEGR